jgi:predicted membrane protein
MTFYKRNSNGPIVFGVFLIILGALWALSNTGALEFRIREWWPLILIAIGLLHITNHRRIFDFFGWLFMGMGVLFLLTENNILNKHEVWKYWPVILILIGFNMILNWKKGDAYSGVCCASTPKTDENGDAPKTEDPTESSDDRIKEDVVFGSVNRRVTSKNFKGGTISSVFGSAEIDLRSAELAEEGAFLDVSTVFAGAEIKIPESWTVETRISAVFGGADRKYSNPEKNDGKRLVINANAVFGGIEIKN